MPLYTYGRVGGPGSFAGYVGVRLRVARPSPGPAGGSRRADFGPIMTSPRAGRTGPSPDDERTKPMSEKRYWLMKSEPDVYSIDDLQRDGSTCWEGVRNYKARNNMRDMNVGDEVLYYHSNAKPPGVVGIARVCREAYPDSYAFEVGHKYFDPKSDPEKPRWFMVDVEYVAHLPEPVGLDEIKAAQALTEMELVRYGRLSVQSVRKSEFDRVKKMGGMT